MIHTVTRIDESVTVTLCRIQDCWVVRVNDLNSPTPYLYAAVYEAVTKDPEPAIAAYNEWVNIYLTKAYR